MAKKPKLDPMLEKAMVRMGIDPRAHMVKQRKSESLLAYRCRQWGMDEPTFQPIDDCVIVKRLPPIQVSAGGLIMPETEQSPHVKGVLLAMGPRAMDILTSNGIELGHVVTWGRFAGAEGRDMGDTHYKAGEILMLKAKDIIGSDDLKAALKAGTLRVVQDADGRHKLAKVTGAERQLPARKEKLLRLANGTNNPHEAAAARRAAEGME